MEKCHNLHVNIHSIFTAWTCGIKGSLYYFLFSFIDFVFYHKLFFNFFILLIFLNIVFVWHASQNWCISFNQITELLLIVKYWQHS